MNKLPTEVFFQYLLPITNSIMTDSQQTPQGEKFWKSAILTAFSNNLNIYIYMVDTQKLIIVSSLQTFNKIKDGIWGFNDEYQNSRVIISNNLYKVAVI